MQQRPTTISSLQLSPIRNLDDTELPLYDPRCNATLRRSRSSYQWWIHTIPIIAVFSLFILWWLSYPVHLVIKDGRIAEIHRIERDLDEIYVDITILAAAVSPTAPVPHDLKETDNQAVGSIGSNKQTLRS